MKPFYSLLLSLFILIGSEVLHAQELKGTVIIDSLYSENLENNFGEKPTRALSVYLPPGYEDSGSRYPVIYYLHGFLNNHKLWPQMIEVLDFAIATHKIRPFILVVSDHQTTYDGSFYSNTIFGNWEDFTAYDLVEYMDENYRTIPDRMSRGITGHSMGAYGAIKIAMHHPEIFSSVYGMSPGAVAIASEYGPNSNTYRELAQVKDMEELKKTYFAKVIVAFARSWSPNPDKPPFYADIPFEYAEDGSLITHKDVLEKWYDQMPAYMVEDYLENLQQLTAIKFDWGRNSGDRFTIQNMILSQRLENAGITHFAEEYIGTHVSGIFTKDGRVTTDMLPFFDFYLEFDN